MATNTKSMNVKVSTSKLIKALEAARDKREKELADFKKARENYEKEYEAFEKSLLKLIGTPKLTLRSSTITRTWRNDHEEVVFTFGISGAVKKPQEPEHIGHYHANQIEEIKNAISILKMTDDEFVGTNTYKGVAQYI